MVTINIGRKEAVVFGVFVFIFLIVGFSVAFGGTVPSDMGHSVGEIEWSQTIPQANIGELCLSGDCKTVWPSGSSGSSSPLTCQTVSSSCSYCGSRTATCPAGTTVTGGSCNFNNDDDAQGTIIEDYVVGNGYFCKGGEHITAYAQCCSGGSDPTQPVKGSIVGGGFDFEVTGEFSDIWYCYDSNTWDAGGCTQQGNGGRFICDAGTAKRLTGTNTDSQRDEDYYACIQN